ncbi:MULTISPECIES: mechanosensitive ion channel family protein [unclassified Flavobacterium]|uniref:mechanosensitive ion channel family protein n=1 Tax=unclassified Flavobacterium TaxID=196869 RepID=UPI001292552B|nr:MULTISPECIES: mechanosensitive ion channel domain-containing protein [unclassified Flavobacterium]MQP52249.1 mechanosensitive ion channel [Flavobacterium sp. LMO9]MQP62319.1 mechanosensitive ion channel [Flavobacterium sp. LMO6]
MKIFNWAYDIFKSLDFNDAISSYLNLAINIVVLVIVTYLLDYIFKKIFIIFLAIVAARTKSTFDDFLVANKTAKYLAHLVPLFFIYKTVPVILSKFTYWEDFFEKGVKIYIIILSLWITRSIFNALKDYLKNKPRYSDKPIDSYIQVIMIVLWVFGITSFVLIMFDTNMKTLLTTFGAISALIFLIFKDTILGFVASIQVSVNDMVRIGDWITMEKFGADGDVIEINLATVKVRNFDNTTTTIPTYSLISDSFKNWRGMLDSDGRRIKRHLLIKSNSVKFLEKDAIEKFKKIQHLTSYIEHRQADIDKYNTNNKIDKSVIVNGRNLTNLGLFRKYINQYILSHPGINKDMLLMVRYLQPTEHGIPLEIYCFSKDKEWINYEHIMADIFDHVMASLPYFDLEVFEIISTPSTKSDLQ